MENKLSGTTIKIPMLTNLSYECSSADEAWEHWFDILKPTTAGDEPIAESRGGTVVGEIINATTYITDPTRCIMRSNKRKMPMRYAVGELLWYMSKTNKLSAIMPFSPFWQMISDDGETVNSNYGHCIHNKFGFDQWDYIRDMLRDNPETRQAVIHIKEPRNTITNPTKDVNCTVMMQFFVRGGKLHLTVYMRSNDIWLGFPFDVFQFTSMQILMAMELGVEIGTYTHHAGSLHLYTKNWREYLEGDYEK